MNCNDFKKHMLCTPRDMTEAILSHKSTCPDCYQFSLETLVFEDKMEDAFLVMPPVGFSETVMEKSLSAQSSHKMQRISYAMAASVFFMVGLIFLTNMTLSKPITIEQMVLTHIEKEPFALTATMALTDKDVTGTLASLGITMGSDFPKIRFLKRCIVGDELVAHMIIEGKNGPVTVLIMPNESITHAKNLHSEQLEGIVVPFQQGGSIAVVGFMGEPIKNLAVKAQAVFGLES